MLDWFLGSPEMDWCSIIDAVQPGTSGNKSRCMSVDEENLLLFKDPCWFESRQSMKCLEDNGYDRTQCQKQFDNYQVKTNVLHTVVSFKMRIFH